MESQYLQLVQKVLSEGHEREGRNGLIKSMFGASLECDLADGFPY